MGSLESYFYFVCTIIVMAIVTIFVVFRDFDSAKKYLKENPSVYHGIVWFIGVAIAIVIGWLALVSVAKADDWRDLEKGRLFSYGNVYLGLDKSLQVSPFCYEYGPDNRATSNGGITLNVFESTDKKYAVDAVYTHHSCAFNLDNTYYDAVGLKATIYLWK